MDFVQINKFSKLHNEGKVIFCKTDFIFEEFKNIEKIPHDIILITGTQITQLTKVDSI
jgi:transposase